MKLTKTTDFALRLVLFLAQTKEPKTMHALSEDLKIPFHNLSKLVQVLSKSGILQTRQGKNGGVELLQNPQEISLKTVIDIIDGPTRLSDCSKGSMACELTASCKLKGAFLHIQKEIDTLFDKVKIASLVES